MAKTAKLSLVILTALALTMVVGCSKMKTMSDKDFTKITSEWLTEYLGVAMQKAFSGAEVSDKEMEKLAYDTLEKVCKKYGYTRAQFEEKAKKSGKDLKDVLKGGMEGQGWK
jgi:hypothetical protein